MKPVDESREAYPPGCQVRSQARPALQRWPGRYARAHGSAGRIVGEEPAASGSLIDEIVREGARRMLAEALQAEVMPTLRRSPPSGTRTAGGWWSAMATTSRGRC